MASKAKPSAMHYNLRMRPDSFFYPIFNRLLAEQPALRARMAAHAGKTVCIEWPLVSLVARIDEEGALAAAPADTVSDVRIRVRLPALLAFVAGDAEAWRLADVEGDAALAGAIASWMREFDGVLALRPWLGELGAARTVQALSALSAWHAAATHSVGCNIAEYAVYEAAWLADAKSVRRFVAAVDELRDATARLEARLRLLEQRR